MLIRERLVAVPEKKKDDFTVHWLVAIGSILVLGLTLQNYARQSLGLDLPQVLLEILALGFVLGLPYLGIIALSGLVSGRCGWGFTSGLAHVSIILLPQAIFMGYAHFAMSEALAPLKRQFAERIGNVRGEGGQRNGPLKAKAVSYDDLLDARDSLLDEYGYLRIGAWQAGEDGADCYAVYLFTAGILVNQSAQEGQEEPRDAF